MITRRLPTFLFTLLAAFALPAAADDVGVTSARLMELPDGGFAVEADVAPVQVAALRPPIVPERFTPAERPSYRRVGVGLVVRYEFGGSDRPLEAGDVLLLPWARSAVLLTARWADGEVHRAMLPGSPVGIRVPIETLRPAVRSPAAVARRHAGTGLDRGAWSLLRLLLVFAIVAAAGVGSRAVRLVLVFSGGHALAMVALDLGAPTLPPALAASGLGLGAALLARSALREDGKRLWPLVLALGLIDGLGIAGMLVGSGLGAAEVVPALFGAAMLVDVVQLAAAALMAVVWSALRRRRLAAYLSGAVGCVAMAAVIATTVSGLGGVGKTGIDPADRMAAASFNFKTAAGAGGPTARAAAPPRRLEDAAMLFLTVDPMEVRVEVLLGLRDFLEPLRIEGGPGSAIPVEVQGAIAARARRMVVSTVSVVIDGREAVALLESADFVTVAATGVATRDEPQSEALDTAVLGVTLVYGVDRPPSEVTARWRVFPERETAIPAVSTDPGGSARVALTPQEPELRWANDLSSYEAPPVRVLEVSAPHWPVVSMLLAAVAVSAWIGPLRRTRWRFVAWGALAAAIVLYPFLRHPVSALGIGGWAPARAEMAEVVDGLLTNVYRSFDLRDEEAIYDRLAVSVTGEQLTEVYLENQRALALENLGGARARVDEVEVVDVQSVRRDGEGGFAVEATWTVSGSVSHFGHVHYRQNRYDAALHILDVDGAWKIREIELLQERRLL